MRRVISLVMVLVLLPATLFASPLLVKQIGGATTDSGKELAQDGSGNIILLGTSIGTVDLGGGPVSGLGNEDVFLAKYTSTGSLLWSRILGGGTGDNAIDVVVDASNNIYVTGWFTGTANFGGSSLISAGDVEIFLAKYDPNGNHLWSKRFGSTGRDESRGLAVDASGNVALTGRFENTVDFGGGPLVAGIMIAKYTTAGAHLWSKRYGGLPADEGMDVAFDPSGNLIAVGDFSSATINFGGSTFSVYGGFDAYAVKLDAAGNHVWSHQWGGPSADTFLAVDVDDFGHVSAAGYFVTPGLATADFGGGPYQSAGVTDIIIARYSSASGDHVWSRHYGGVGRDQVEGIDVDAVGNVVATGFHEASVDFNGHVVYSSGDFDINILKFGADGVAQSSRSYGGVGRDVGESCAWTASGDLLVTGWFENTVNFDGVILTGYASSASDAFLLKVVPVNLPGLTPIAGGLLTCLLGLAGVMMLRRRTGARAVSS